MRALKKFGEVPARPDGSVEALFEQFSTIALELSPSLGMREFARRLTERAAEILQPRMAVFAIRTNHTWQIARIHGPVPAWGEGVQERLAASLGEAIGSSRSPLVSGAAPTILGSELSETLCWRSVLMIRLARHDGSFSGLLCFADSERQPSPTERQFLTALAAHASVALENVRLFSRIEHSRKQWVEDVDALSDFILVHNGAGRVLRLNRSLADTLGMPPAELIGRDVGCLGVLGSERMEGNCPFCRSSPENRDEFTYQAGSHTYVVSTSRIQSSGGVSRTVHILKDITEQREAERRYRRERDFNRNILNHTRSMIVVLDAAGLVSYANRRCFELGYRERDLLGSPLAEMVPAAQRPVLAQAVERALKGAAVDNLELPMLRAGGTGQFSVSLTPMQGDDGAINSVVAVMTDVTDAASLQMKLMHAEKMAALGQLVSGVAHEVNNPLAAIVGFTDLLIENPSIPGDAKQDLDVILREAERTRQIVQNLLSFSRQMPAHREPLRVSAIVQQTLKLRAYDLMNHGVEVIENYGDELPLAVGNPQELQQVFLNVLNNAYDAIQEVRRRGKLEIAACACNGRVEIRFRDNGPGIRHPDRIFDPFYTTKAVGKGTGLGLSICYGIVQAHGGEIVAENNSDGIGCTFRILLPAVIKTAEFEVAEEKGS